MSVLKAWRQSPTTQAERINALCYLPGQDSIVGHAFNTFKDVSVKPIEGVDVSEMLDHIHDNICNENTEYYHYVVKWLAHLVQHPAKRPMTGIAIIGDQGTGKGVFIDFLKRLMGGPRNANTTASSDDTKGFNYALGNKLLVVFDEATFAGDRKQSDFMKKLVTEPRIRIEQKGLDAYEVDNFARVMITSNNRNSAVPANIGARRWLIMDCRGDLAQTELRAFANRIGNNPGHPDEDTNYANGFKQHLLSVDLTSFNPQQLPMQDTGLETKLQNHYKEDPTFAFLCEWLAAKQLTLFRMKIERGPAGEEEYDVAMQWDEEVLFSDFYAVFKESCSGAYARAPGQNMMRKLLDPYGITVQSGTANVRYVHLPPPNKVLALLRRSSRFDLLVDAEQVAIIDAYKMYKDNAHRRSLQTGTEAATIEVPINRSDEATIEWLHQIGRAHV